jgi:hypothetical protein
MLEPYVVTARRHVLGDGFAGRTVRLELVLPLRVPTLRKGGRAQKHKVMG